MDRMWFGRNNPAVEMRVARAPIAWGVLAVVTLGILAWSLSSDGAGGDASDRAVTVVGESRGSDEPSGGDAEPVSKERTIAQVNAACAAFFTADPTNAERVTSSDYRNVAINRIRALDLVLEVVDEIEVLPEDESLREEARDYLLSARALLQINANLPDTPEEIAGGSEAQVRDATATVELARLAILLVVYGAEDCRPVRADA